VQPGGVRKNTTIDFEFMDSPEFTDLSAIYSDLAVLGTPPYSLGAANGEPLEFTRVEDLAQHVHELGKKGSADPALQGPGRDEPRAAVGDHRWTRPPDAAAGPGRGRRRGRPPVLDA
jgi:hypothetical protein